MTACAVVVSFSTGPVLQTCLNALAFAGADEIVIVDNGNPDTEEQAIDAFAAAHANVRVVRGQGNIGFAAASNLGARRAASDILVFVNPDVRLAERALSALARAVEDNPGPVLVGGDLRDEHGRPERGSRRERLTLWRAFVSFTGLSKLEPIAPAFRDFNRHTDPLPASVVDSPTISGALMAVRRTDFASLGGFDESYFLHVEDVDLCRRAEQAGWRVLFAPGPHGVHERSTSASDPRAIALHKARGFRRYFRKFARGPFARLSAEAVGMFLVVLAALKA